MKKLVKILGIIIVVFAVLVAAVSCMADYGNSDSAPSDRDMDNAAAASPDSSPDDSSDTLSAKRPEAAPLEASGDLGNYHVEIGECTLTKDYSGRAAAVISYTFTNNGDEAESAMVALLDRAFQNGVSLETAIFADDSIVNSADVMKDIQPGASIEIKEGFLLSSESAPIEYELQETISFSDDKLGKTFVIDENGKTEYPTAPQGSKSGTLGDYDVSIISSEIGDDYDGKDVLIVHYGFTNNGKKEASFSLSISAEAFQNGVELERAYFADSNDASSLYVKPGAGIEVVLAYELPDTSATVNLEVSELLSFSDEKLTATIELG